MSARNVSDSRNVRARQRAQASHDQGEILNFETAAALFGRLTDRRWALMQTLLGAGEWSVRDLARRVGCDVEGLREDLTALIELGLLEDTDRGGIRRPFDDIHVDVWLQRAAWRRERAASASPRGMESEARPSGPR